MRHGREHSEIQLKSKPKILTRDQKQIRQLTSETVFINQDPDGNLGSFYRIQSTASSKISINPVTRKSHGDCFWDAAEPTKEICPSFHQSVTVPQSVSLVQSVTVCNSRRLLLMSSTAFEVVKVLISLIRCTILSVNPDVTLCHPVCTRPNVGLTVPRH